MKGKHKSITPVDPKVDVSRLQFVRVQFQVGPAIVVDQVIAVKELWHIEHLGDKGFEVSYTECDQKTGDPLGGRISLGRFVKELQQ